MMIVLKQVGLELYPIAVKQEGNVPTVHFNYIEFPQQSRDICFSTIAIQLVSALLLWYIVLNYMQLN